MEQEMIAKNNNLKSSNLDEYLENHILPIYSEFDQGHDPEHIMEVLERSLSIAKLFKFVDLQVVKIVAYFHDIGLNKGRRNHHYYSAQLLAQDPVISRKYSEKEITIMMEAIEDHRASNRGKPRNLYGTILSQADNITDASKIIRRTLSYGKDVFSHYDEESQIMRAYFYLVNKYSEGGYYEMQLDIQGDQERLLNLREILKTYIGFRAYCVKIMKEETKILTLRE
ncbi:HD domain-containing protein [Enterococcus sp. AZ101]|uniref:HD domain-containing protein n=1 Tax=Enterococcus sp. AZ101 TaxID=2774742 RepID=UPI003D2922CC